MPDRNSRLIDCSDRAPDDECDRRRNEGSKHTGADGNGGGECLVVAGIGHGRNENGPDGCRRGRRRAGNGREHECRKHGDHRQPARAVPHQATSIKRCDMPPAVISSPASMNRGMASRLNDCDPATNCCARNAGSMSATTSTRATTIPIAKANGTPSITAPAKPTVNSRALVVTVRAPVPALLWAFDQAPDRKEVGQRPCDRRKGMQELDRIADGGGHGSARHVDEPYAGPGQVPAEGCRRCIDGRFHPSTPGGRQRVQHDVQPHVETFAHAERD